MKKEPESIIPPEMWAALSEAEEALDFETRAVAQVTEDLAEMKKDVDTDAADLGSAIASAQAQLDVRTNRLPGLEKAVKDSTEAIRSELVKIRVAAYEQAKLNLERHVSKMVDQLLDGIECDRNNLDPHLYQSTHTLLWYRKDTKALREVAERRYDHKQDVTALEKVVAQYLADVHQTEEQKQSAA